MEPTARNHVLELTTVLSIVSLALVFAAALGVVPSWALPDAPDSVVAAIPHVNAVISLLAIGVIAGAWRDIRRGNVTRHRRGMLAGVALFVAFLALYLYKVALEGPAPFPGPDDVYQFVYLPLLAVHVILAVVCIPLLYYVLLLALTRPVGSLPSSNHPRVGRVAVSLWLTSFFLGFVVYLLLYVVY
jgi:putative membrane protein